MLNAIKFLLKTIARNELEKMELFFSISVAFVGVCIAISIMIPIVSLCSRCFRKREPSDYNQV